MKFHKSLDPIRWGSLPRVGNNLKGTMMKAGAIIGIIGGVFSLIYGAVGYSTSSALGDVSSIFGAQDVADSFAFYKYASLLIPIAGLIGAGLAFTKPKIGAGLMALTAVGVLGVFGVWILPIICGGLLGIGALLVFLSLDKGPYHYDTTDSAN